MAARVLTMVGGHDHLITRRAPLRQKVRQRRVHPVAGIVHLFAVVVKPVPQTVQRAAVQDAIVYPLDHTQPRQRGEQVGIGGRHLVVARVARHGVKAAMADRALRLVIFDVADVIERIAVEEFRPEGMRHRPGLQPGLDGLRKHIRKLQPPPGGIAPDAMDLRCQAGVD